MGFGNGYSQRTKRGGKSYSNDMTAHVWNAQSAERGQSSNGNFYFSGRALYSYGSHFVVGYIMPDGVAFLNADTYSISTSGHQSDARAATRDRRTVLVAGLTDLAGDWKILPRVAQFMERVSERGATAAERRDIQASVRKALVTHAAALSAEIYRAGASRYEWDDEARKSITQPGETEAGAYLAALVGLPAATWNKAKRDAAKIAADEKAAKEKAARASAEARALQLADIPSRNWREWIASLGAEYSDHVLRNIRRDLFNARGLMLKATSGKLAAKSRLATVRDRIKWVSMAIDQFDTRKGRLEKAKGVRLALATVRQWRDASAEAKANPSWSIMRDVASAAERLESIGRTLTLKESAARLASQARAGMIAIEAENNRQRRLEVERSQLAEAERRTLWLAGERVGRVRFDAEGGGAALRVMGDTLETSHGAEVPLSHAVKVFRFVKLCKERGETWRRNGHTIRVGHFQVDRVDCTGDFTAGCHFITWQEVERVAKAAGVFDCPADDAAVISSSEAA